MSLVDYGSSSEEEEEEEKEERETVLSNNQHPLLHPISKRPSDKQPQSSLLPETPVIKLPDASLLLDPLNVTSHLVSGSDHSSRVAAALAEPASRKREANMSTNALRRTKVPKGNLPHARISPDTGKGLLVPPQLSGRHSSIILLSGGTRISQDRG